MKVVMKESDRNGKIYLISLNLSLLTCGLENIILLILLIMRIK